GAKGEHGEGGGVLACAGRSGRSVAAGRHYLPQDWARGPVRRAKTHVPAALTFQEGWRIGVEWVDQGRAGLRGAWVAADDEFGRVTAFRAGLRRRQLRYVVDVPCNTLVRDVTERLEPTRPGGKPRLPPFERVEAWGARQPEGRGRRVGRAAGHQRARGGGGVLGGWAGAGEGGRGGGRWGGGGEQRDGAGGESAVGVEQRRAGRPQGVGGGAGQPAGGRGVVGGGQGGGRAGALRGAQLGGLAPPRDTDAFGVVVFA